MIVIGITGTLGAGKSTIAEYLAQKWGFAHYSFRDFTVEEVKKRRLTINRNTMVQVANELRSKFGPGYIAEELYKRAEFSGKNSVLESIRTVGEVESLRRRKNFYLFAVDAEPRMRYQRICERKSATDAVSYEKFLEDEERESKSDDPSKQNLAKCMELADYNFNNNGTHEELYSQIDKVLNKIL